MKEPLVADFLERFLDLHDLSNKSSPVSRPTSVRSRLSSRSITNNSVQQNRLSYRLSQAELLDYSHQQQQQRLNASPDNSSNSNHTPRTSSTPSTLSPNANSNHPSPNLRPSLPHRLSRGPSMTSLDAAMTSM